MRGTLVTRAAGRSAWPASSRRSWRARASPLSSIDDVSVGCAIAGRRGQPQRRPPRDLLLAGLPVETPGSVHNRLCGSGLNAHGRRPRMPSPAARLDVCLAGGVGEHDACAVRGRQGGSALQQELHGVSIHLSAPASPTQRSRASSAPTPCRRPPTIWRATISFRAKPATASRFALAAEVCQGQRRLACSRARSSRCRSRRRKGKADIVVANDEHPRPRNDPGEPAEAEASVSAMA